MCNRGGQKEADMIETGLSVPGKNRIEQVLTRMHTCIGLKGTSSSKDAYMYRCIGLAQNQTSFLGVTHKNWLHGHNTQTFAT